MVKSAVPGRDDVAGVDGAIGDDAVDRRAHDGVALLFARRDRAVTRRRRPAPRRRHVAAREVEVARGECAGFDELCGAVGFAARDRRADSAPPARALSADRRASSSVGRVDAPDHRAAADGLPFLDADLQHRSRPARRARSPHASAASSPESIGPVTMVAASDGDDVLGPDLDRRGASARRRRRACRVAAAGGRRTARARRTARDSEHDLTGVTCRTLRSAGGAALRNWSPRQRSWGARPVRRGAAVPAWRAMAAAHRRRRPRERQVGQQREPGARHLQVARGLRAVGFGLLQQQPRVGQLELRRDAGAVAHVGDLVGAGGLLDGAGAGFPRRLAATSSAHAERVSSAASFRDLVAAARGSVRARPARCGSRPAAGRRSGSAPASIAPTVQLVRKSPSREGTRRVGNVAEVRGHRRSAAARPASPRAPPRAGGRRRPTSSTAVRGTSGASGAGLRPAPADGSVRSACAAVASRAANAGGTSQRGVARVTPRARAGRSAGRSSSCLSRSSAMSRLARWRMMAGAGCRATRAPAAARTPAAPRPRTTCTCRTWPRPVRASPRRWRPDGR